ncbi:hypothetical protein Golomagni_06683 [Golovinomyces magnicellulatus]|nr:hypothetical protein Golomagni_06683 [Golovinomyces magnicellulatus]
MTDTRYIFGGKLPWQPSEWVTSDDRVRGGSSQSHLTVSDPSKARFHGNLDTSTLGGAGFASQYSAGSLDLDLSDYDGIVLDVIEASDHKRYALTIKDNIPPRRGDGRLKSTVTWEAEFKPSGPGEIFLPWDDFKATYRGKDRPEEEPLDLKSIKRIGIMMRSFFDEQDGDFSIELRSIAAQRVSDDEADDIKQYHKHSPIAEKRSGWKSLFCGLLG